MMQVPHQRDPIYSSCIVLLAICATLFPLLHLYSGVESLRLRPLSALLALLVALGLALRNRNGRHLISTLIGGGVVVLCGAQLLLFVLGERIYLQDSSSQVITQNFAAGMFCLGCALVLDGVLPARWGRHLLFGLLGAIVAAIGFLGLIGTLSIFHVSPELLMLRGMRMPSGLILVFAGLALLTGARLRSFSANDASVELGHTGELRDRTGIAAALVMLLVTLGATLLVWREARIDIAANETEALDRSVGRFSKALETNALGSLSLLDGLRGLLEASDEVEEDEWGRYVSQIRLSMRYEGVLALGYAKHVRAPYRDSDGRRYLENHGKKIAIWPNQERTDYFPVVYRAPASGAYHQVIGYDLAASPEHALTIARAAKTGNEAISAHVDFSDFNDTGGRAGYVVIAPFVDSKDRSGADVLPSFVYAAVDVKAVVEKSLVDAGSGSLDLQVLDVGPDGTSTEMFRSTGFVADRSTNSSSIDLAGRTWKVLAQRGAHVASSTSQQSSAILVAGSFCALMLFAITWVLAGHRARALHLAGQMNAELRKSQRSHRAVTETANVGIITADSDGRIVYMNPFAAASFGLNAEAVIGQSLTIMMPERFRAAHRAGLERILTSDSPKTLGATIELSGLHCNGSEFPIEILLSVWTSDGDTFFTAFVRDISNRKQSEMALEQRTRDLERSNADLEQFAYVASHDLQEPLRMVASYVQLLARRYKGRLDSDADEFIGFAVDGATRMQRLIQDLLAYARLGRSGKLPIPTHIGECAQSATTHLQEAIIESGARLRIDADCEALVIPSLLVQVFQNLIANALKFRKDAEPQIQINVVRDGKFWHVSVSDNGIGIEPQHRERVFAIFQRLHTRREYPGTGIGLAICRKIIESFGGTIWVESDAGSGSTFHFTIPAAD